MLRTILLIPIALLASAVASAGQHQFHHEHVLGTSLSLTMEVKSPSVAKEIEARCLAEIDRLDAVFSRYRDDSELSRFNLQPVGRQFAASPELIEVMAAAERIRVESNGAFDPRSGAIATRWLTAAEHNRRPTDGDREALAAALRNPMIAIEGNQLTRLTDHAIGLDAIAKGYILDRVCLAVRPFLSTNDGFIINIGGDLRSIGSCRTRVVITDPRRASEHAAPLVQFTSDADLAIATSGTYRRAHRVGTHSISHLLDPRTARPSDGVLSASVIAPTAMRADALATAVSVLTPDEAIAWIDKNAGHACLIVTREGDIRTSRNWPSDEGDSGPGSSASDPCFPVDSPRHGAKTLVGTTNADQPGLHVWFKLERPEGGHYRRPYLAVWLEDVDGFPVKTAVLWIQTEHPGPRWLRDLTRWYRNDRMRRIAEQTNLIETVSGATRGPGEYEAHFDGTDNDSEPLPAGRYTLCLEAARENGTYKIIRKRFEWGTAAIEKADLKGNIEITEAAFEFIPPVQ